VNTVVKRAIGELFKILISEAWNLYKADKEIQGYSTQKLKVYSVQLSLLIRYLGDIKITDITTESIKLYLGEVAAELKAASLCHRIRFIKSLFKWAQEEKYISKNHKLHAITRFLPLLKT
jgi:integrase/recombinase XerD